MSEAVMYLCIKVWEGEGWMGRMVDFERLQSWLLGEARGKEVEILPWLIGWLAPCVCNRCQLQLASSRACLACCYSPLLSQSGPVLLTLAIDAVHCVWRFVLRLPEHRLLCCLPSDLKVILLSWIAFVPCASFCGNWTSLSVLPSVWSEGNSPQPNCFCTLWCITWTSLSVLA